MKTLVCAIALLSISILANAQKHNNSIEGEFYFRYDKYPTFFYAPNATRMHKVNAAGTSFGATLAYRLQLQKPFFLKTGIGYYKYSFSKMKVYDPIFGELEGRLTLYEPQNTRAYLATPDYWYNCISINIVPEYHLALGKNWLMAAGLGITNYLTFSQVYTFQNIENAKFGKFSYQGTSVTGQLAFLQQYGRLMVGPRMIIPFFDSYKQDSFFSSEDNSLSRSKWLGGLGLGLSCAYSLTK